MKRNKLTAKRLRECLDYNPEIGVFTRRPHFKHERHNTRYAGKIAGCICPNWGYRVINVNNVLYRSARLAVLYMTGRWPKDEVDHINRDKADDRWKNLRAATSAENHWNCEKKIFNTSGFKGVSWLNTRKTWRVRLNKNGRDIHVGSFKNLNDAVAAYAVAAQEHHGEFARS